MVFPGKKALGWRTPLEYTDELTPTQEVPLTFARADGTIAPATLFCGWILIFESGKAADDTGVVTAAMDRRTNMADGASPDAHDWSDPMAKRASKSDLEAKGPILKVVGGTPTPKPMTISLDSDVETHIGGRLRAMYDSVLREPVPDRFLDLLRQIDDKLSGEPAAGVLRDETKPDER